MKQENKELLLQDLGGRIPYGVKMNHIADTENNPVTLVGIAKTMITLESSAGYGTSDIEDYIPYLFPLSSMTKKQYKEWSDLSEEPLDEILTRNANGEKMSTLEHHLLIAKSLSDPINYCYKNHFDIYGLIPMGLANDATGLNIY